MTDKTIRAGDLVMVVKPKPCCGKGLVGKIFTVDRLKVIPGRCSECGYKYEPSLVAIIQGDGSSVDVDRLIKISPPPQGQSPITHIDVEVEA